MRYLIGLDIGTSGAKCIVADEFGRVTASATLEYPLYTPQPGWAEQNPIDWWNAVVQGTKKILAKSGIGNLFISRFGEGYYRWNSPDGSGVFTYSPGNDGWATLRWKFFDGDVAGSRELQLKYLELINNLFIEVNPIPVKTACGMMGLCSDLMRLPLCEMDDANKAKLAASMAKAGLI